MKKSDPDPPIESPIPFRTGSNGEFEPPAPTARDRAADEMFHRLAADNARRLGVSRRDFVSSTMGTATALFVINQVYGCTAGGFCAVLEMLYFRGSQVSKLLNQKPRVGLVRLHDVDRFDAKVTQR